MTGVQTSGKTFLAKFLVNDLQKNGNKMNCVLICFLDELQWEPGEKVNIYIINDTLYELQV